MIERYMIFAAAISNIHKNIQKLERKEMERFGLKGPHGQCLLAVAGHPEGITAAQLCHCCEKDKAAISRSLSELEKLGLVTRGTGYRALLRLTPQGKTMVEQISAAVKTAMERASVDMSGEQRLAFYETLNQIAENLESVCGKGVPTE